MNQPKWMTTELKTLMNQRDFLKFNGQYKEYKTMRNKVLYEVKAAKNNYYKFIIKNACGNTKKIWHSINEISGKHKSRIPRKMHIADKEVTDRAEIVKEFSKYFANVASNSISSETWNSDDQYEVTPDFQAFVQSRLPSDTKFSIPLITPSRVKDLLLHLDPSKATGMDGISPYILQRSAFLLVEPLTLIINNSIQSGIFPSSWKIAKLFPVYKNGDASDINNYRPISILTSVSKLIERHVHDHLYAFLSRFNLITDSQSGFRPIHSCQTCVTKIVNNWQSFINQGDIVGCISLDLRRAFDLLNHDILLKKLQLYGLDDRAVKWFKSYLTCRKHIVCIDTYLSNEEDIHYGIPQGSMLGPLLFIIFINDLPCHIKSSLLDMYADDSNIYDHSPDIEELEKRLNSSCKEVSNWVQNNNLVVNHSKSCSMLICSHQKRAFLPKKSLNVTLDKSVLCQVTDMKLLGVTIDQNMTWKCHIDKVTTRVSSLIGLLYRIRPCINKHCMLLFYNSFILPLFGYCINIWGKQLLYILNNYRFSKIGWVE